MATSSATGVDRQIPRNSLALLMLAQAAVVIPHAAHLSPWIIGVCLVCGYWRSMVYLGRWAFPQPWVKSVLVLASCVGLAVSGVTVFSLEAAASLCILAFALKLIEMKTARDAYVVIFLGYFNIATEFLFAQSLLVAAYGILAAVVVTAAMVGLNQLHTRVKPLASLRVAGILIFQALPLTVVFFLLFPRIAPLWTVPLPSGASSGISDRLKPGDIASLTQSDEIAFRAVFAGTTPASPTLYWRGLVYSDFKLGEWTMGAPAPKTRPKMLPVSEPGLLNYQVLLEPTYSNWLFALDAAAPTSPHISARADFRLEANEPIMSLLRYQVQSDPSRIMDASLAPFTRDRALALPVGDNPRVMAFARELWRQRPEPEAFAQAILMSIRRDGFSYTLNPPLLKDTNSIDEFWFDTKKGFCTHYAGAFVYILRTVGIPARMVGGYQGGEINPRTGHVVVRQYDAHAWAEIWISGKGWLRVDPTAAIAPARIARGLAAALPDHERAELSALTSIRLGDFQTAVNFLQLLDSVEHSWNMWVLGYDTRLQRTFLKDLLGGVTPLKIGVALLVGTSGSLALVAVAIFWRRPSKALHPVERAFRQFANVAEKYGYLRELRESPAAFVRRVGEDNGYSGPELTELLIELDRLLYDPGPILAVSELRKLQMDLFRLRLRLVFGIGASRSATGEGT